MTDYDLLRREALPAWIADARPGALGGLDLATLPATYLAELYPYLWAYGPRGEIFTRQLTCIHDLLSVPQPRQFIDALYNAMDAMVPVSDDTQIIGDLTDHAVTTGHPINGNSILYGIDPSAGDHRHIGAIVNHPVWTNDRNGLANCEEFLYQFSLLSLHLDYFKTFDDHRVLTALKEYIAFCLAWDIPV